MIFGAVIFASFMLTSCSQKPTEIKLSDLDTACDYVDAIEKCVDAIIELKDYEGELPEEKQEYARQLNEKITEADVEECKNFETVQNKMKSHKI